MTSRYLNQCWPRYMKTQLIFVTMTSSNRNIFRVTGPLSGESTGHQWISLTKPMMQSIVVFFDLPLNKRLSKLTRRRRFDTPSRSIWRHCNVHGKWFGRFRQYKNRITWFVWQQNCAQSKCMHHASIFVHAMRRQPGRTRFEICR